MHISGFQPSCQMFNCRFCHLTVYGRCCQNFQLSCMFNFFFCRDGLVEAKTEYLDNPDLLHWRCGSACTAAPRHRNRRSRNLLTYLLSERDTAGGMHFCAYLRPYLFRNVHVFWTACGSKDELVSMSWSDQRQSFGITSCCSMDTHSPYSDVYLENSGEVLPNFCLNQIGAWKLTHIRIREWN
jgi:hypothetical protein